MRRLAKKDELQDNNRLEEHPNDKERNFKRQDDGAVDTDNSVMYLDCKPGVTYLTVLSMFMVFFTNFSFSSYVFFILIFLLEDPSTFNMSPDVAL